MFLDADLDMPVRHDFLEGFAAGMIVPAPRDSSIRGLANIPDSALRPILERLRSSELRELDPAILSRRWSHLATTGKPLERLIYSDDPPPLSVILLAASADTKTAARILRRHAAVGSWPWSEHWSLGSLIAVLGSVVPEPLQRQIVELVAAGRAMGDDGGDGD